MDRRFTKTTFELLRKIHAKPEDKEWLINISGDLDIGEDIKSRIKKGELQDNRREIRAKLYEQHKEGRNTTFVDKVQKPFKKFVKEGVWRRVSDNIKEYFNDPTSEKFENIFNRYHKGGKNLQKDGTLWASLYGKNTKHRSKGPRIAIIIDSDKIKISFQSEKKDKREKLKNKWNRIGDNKKNDTKRKLSKYNFEYRIGDGNIYNIGDIEEWMDRHINGDKGHVTEICRAISKNEIMDKTHKELEIKAAKAVESLAPIYKMAIGVYADSGPNKKENEHKFYEERLDKFSHVRKIIDLLKSKKQIILEGPPGTSKTYTAFQVVSAICNDGSKVVKGERPYKALSDYKLGKAGEGSEVVWDIVQFHQSYGYEDFVSGIEDISGKGGGGIRLDRVDKVFLSMCKQAEKNPGTHYVLIIDEINRGILGRIFGELILGLEYRGLPIRLQGRNAENADDQEEDTITIPDNLFLIGTMNTADRNIALVDHALRRRFHFFPMPPNREILEEVLQGYIDDPEKSLEDDETIIKVFCNLKSLFEGVETSSTGPVDKINYAVGHTYFMCDDMDDFWVSMHYRVLPLLEEYVREGVLQSEAIKSLKQGESVEGTKKSVENWLESSKQEDELST